MKRVPTLPDDDDDDDDDNDDNEDEDEDEDNEDEDNEVKHRTQRLPPQGKGANHGV